LPPSRSPPPPCARPLRSADLPGASYFAPQGRHISRAGHVRVCARVQAGKLAAVGPAPDSSGAAR